MLIYYIKNITLLLILYGDLQAFHNNIGLFSLLTVYFLRQMTLTVYIF